MEEETYIMKLKNFTYVIIAIFLLVGILILNKVDKNTIQTSSNQQLSNTKIEWE